MYSTLLKSINRTSGHRSPVHFGDCNEDKSHVFEGMLSIDEEYIDT